MLFILTSLIEAKDNYTAMHSENVRKLAVKLAKTLQLSAETIFEISVAATLHDIGKIDISSAILNKPGSLTTEEFEQIKQHPVISSQMLEKFVSFKSIQIMVRHHHERVDGKGYPNGLRGEELSVGSKIIAIADTYDAITTMRSYREASSHEYAMEELTRVAGTQLDAEFVSVFCKMNFDHLDTELYSITNKEPQNQIKRVVTAIDTKGVTAQKENEVLNKKCYILSKSGEKPCKDCPVIRSFKSRNNEVMRREQVTQKGIIVFDIYAIPLVLKEGILDYVIEIIIDRTQETHVETTRQKTLRVSLNCLFIA